MGEVAFQCEGFQLRSINIFDAPELFERFTSKPRVMRYLPIKVHGTLQETEMLIAHYQKLAMARVLTIRRTSGGPLAGVIAVSRYEHSIAFALKVAPDRASMGAGCTIAPEFVQFVLRQKEIYRAWAYTDVDNKGVANLLRNMGAECEGIARRYAVHPNISPEPRDCHLWSICR